ncbi:MAG: FixH family protein [Betaproteobacteria bacterium]|nr:FixH family protein [Betaproteobacteria bacterium]
MRVIFLAFLLLAAAPAIAQRVQADIDCKPAKGLMTYDCVIRLSRGGKPLEGVEVSVGADMPSMPMAHNVKPVKAAPGPKPGEYRARLELEMSGEWAVKLRLSGAVRDQIIVKRNFD